MALRAGRGGLELDHLAVTDATDLVDELAHGEEALGRAAIERAQDHAFDRRTCRDGRDELRRWPDRACLVLPVDVVGRARKQRLAGEQVVVQRAEAVEVRALIDRAPVDLLGRDELRHAGDLLGRRHREREVDELDVLTREQDVLRCEIAVDDADLRGFDQRLADDLDEIRGLIGRDRSAHGDRLGERVSAFEHLHRDPGRVAALAGRQHARHTGALHPLELAQLAFEPLGHARERHHRGGDELDDHGQSGGLVGGPMDRAGSGPAEPGPQLEPRGEAVGLLGLGLERDQPSGVDGTEVRVIAEMLLTLRAELHLRIP